MTNGTDAHRAQDRKKAHIDFERESVELFGELVQVIRIPRSVGQIYGALFASPRGLKFSDLVDHLGMSKGLVSQGLKFLRDVGAIRAANLFELPRERRFEPARDYYAPETELKKVFSGLLKGGFELRLRRGNARLIAFEARHLKTLKTGGETERLLLQRLVKLRQWHLKGKVFLTIMDKFLV